MWCRMPARRQNTSLHSLNQPEMWEETAGARRSYTSCTTSSHSLASDRESASKGLPLVPGQEEEAVGGRRVSSLARCRR